LFFSEFSVADFPVESAVKIRINPHLIFLCALVAIFVKRDFNWLQFKEDFDIVVALEGLAA